ncbi:uncharacterized protein LOC108096596 [Drosophila ficusphila]|uniref:uncharacterized protein LOC108096596 n=1 Tax=Drosophila ficusphila TaxID=30025 RepID=UPI001C8A8C77|nr:uncharacterized protein LOC108096596 [Drosophila ficusphila]
MSKQVTSFAGVCVCLPTQRNLHLSPQTPSPNCFHHGKRKTQCRRFITLISKQRKPRNVMTNRHARLSGDGVIVLIMQTMSACPFLAGRH